jgi:hypothetical protein
MGTEREGEGREEVGRELCGPRFALFLKLYKREVEILGTFGYCTRPCCLGRAVASAWPAGALR